MKKIVLFALMVMGCILTSCEKEMISYEGVEGVYFEARYGATVAAVADPWPYYSYSMLDFIRIPDDLYAFQVKVMATGVAKSYDRTVNVTLDTDATTAMAGQDFDPVPATVTIKAGELYTYLPVSLHRPPFDVAFIVGVKLLPSTDFDLIFELFDQPANLLNSPYGLSGLPIEKQFNATKHQVRVSHVVVRPSRWNGSLISNEERFTLGEYSNKKLITIMEVLHVPYSDFMDATIMTNARMAEIAAQFSQYLVAQYRNHTPVLEEDGRLMWVRGVPWTTFFGSPWDGQFNPEY